MKRQATEKEKIFTNDMTDKGLISKTHKQLIWLNIKNNTSRNGQKIQIDISSKKTYRSPTGISLIIREKQIEATVRYHFIPIRMTIFKNLQIINGGEGAEKRESAYIIAGNVNWYSHYGKQCGSSIKN